MSKVMNAHILQTGPPAQLAPLVVDAAERSVRLLARDHPGIAGNPGDGVQHFGHRGRQRHHARARLAVA